MRVAALSIYRIFSSSVNCIYTIQCAARCCTELVKTQIMLLYRTLFRQKYSHVWNTTQETKQTDRKKYTNKVKNNIVQCSVNNNFKTCRGRQYLQFIFGAVLLFHALRLTHILYITSLNGALVNVRYTNEVFCLCKNISKFRQKIKKNRQAHAGIT